MVLNWKCSPWSTVAGVVNWRPRSARFERYPQAADIEKPEKAGLAPVAAG